MSRPVLPDTFVSRILGLERRVGVLERAPAPSSYLGPVAASQVTPGTYQASTSFRYPSLVVGDADPAATVAGYLQTTGSLSGIRMEDRAGTANPEWVLYPNAGTLGFWTGGTGGQGTMATIQPSGEARFGNARVGTYAPDATYADFRHRDATGYGFMHRNSGLVLINADGTDERIQLRLGGGTHLEVEASRIWAGVPLLINGAHRLGFEDYGGGWFMQDTTYVRCYGDKIIYTNNKVRGGNATMFTGAAHVTYFGHVSLPDADQSLVSVSDGRTVISCSGNQYIRFQDASTVLTQFMYEGSANDIRFITDIPILSSMDDIGRTNTSSRQLGRYTSSGDFKTNIRDAGLDAANPIFEVPVRRFHYDPDKVSNAHLTNKSYPDGLVGLISEEVGEVIFQAANWWKDDDGNATRITSVDHRCLMAYVIAGLRYLKEEADETRSRLAAIEAVPTVAAVLQKGK